MLNWIRSATAPVSFHTMHAVLHNPAPHMRMVSSCPARSDKPGRTSNPLHAFCSLRYLFSRDLYEYFEFNCSSLALSSFSYDFCYNRLLFRFNHGWNSQTRQTLCHAPQELRQGLTTMPRHWSDGRTGIDSKIRHQHEASNLSRASYRHGMVQVQLALFK